MIAVVRDSARRSLATLVSLLLVLLWVPAALASLPASAAAGATTVTPVPVNENCNGVIPTPGSENTHKKLIGGTLEPGGTAIFEITYPIDPADLGQTFTVTDCPILGGNVDNAQAYEFSFVPNNTSFTVEFTLVIPADTPIGTSYCNYAKTTASPSAPQASNRKAGPACFTVGGNLRIEKHATGSTTLLAGAKFTVSCPTAAPTTPITESPVIITGLVDHGDVVATYVAADGAWEASGTAVPGFIAISGPSGTVCTVTETAAPPGYELPATTTHTYTIPVGTAQVVEAWFNAPAVPAVHLVKSAVPASGSTVGLDSSIVYTLSYYNDGNVDATNATITDTLPAFETFQSSSDGGKYDAVTRTITWTIADIGAGTSAVDPAGHVSYIVTVDSNTPDGTKLDNTGHIQLGTGTPVDSNTTHHVVVTPVLSIVKTATPPSGSVVQPGDQIDYTITVTNTGHAVADTQIITDTLPTNVTVVAGSIRPKAMTVDATHIVWVVDVPAATDAGPGTVVLTYSATANADGSQGSTLTNVATLGDQHSTTEHHVATGDLTLVKHVDKTTAQNGDTLTYTFVAAATGDLDQTDVVVTDVVPDHTTYVAGSAGCTDAGTCDATYTSTTNTITWQLGDITAGGPARHLTFQVTIDQPTFDPAVGLAVETVLNSGVIDSTETPATPSNKVMTTTTAVLGVKIVKRPTTPVASPSSTLPFTGMPMPINATLLVALTMIGAGIALTATRRRRG